MTSYEYSRWDGTERFQPQSADQFFDQFSNYLMSYGEEMLPYLEEWYEEDPELIDKLVQAGYVEKDREGKFLLTPKAFRRIENKALEELFEVQRKGALGYHETEHRGIGQTIQEEIRPYRYGDSLANLNLHETMRNSLSREQSGFPIEIHEDDFVVYETEYQSQCATVVLLDMSGSMNRYGKYAAAKKVCLGLQSLVRGKYQGDFLQTVGFYTYASPLSEKELIYSAPKPVSIYDPLVRMKIDLDAPPAFVPQHFTNIHAGLQFARRILSRQPASNKQIITITDGEPTAHIEGRVLHLIYPPSQQTAQQTLHEVKRCANEGIHLASFALIEDYFYLELVNFVEQMAQVSKGVAAYCRAEDLGNLVVDRFQQGRKVRRSF